MLVAAVAVWLLAIPGGQTTILCLQHTSAVVTDGVLAAVDFGVLFWSTCSLWLMKKRGEGIEMRPRRHGGIWQIAKTVNAYV